jgi:hypothetical protein
MRGAPAAVVRLLLMGAWGRGDTYGYGFGEPVADRDGERVRAELRSAADREGGTARGR